MGRYAPPWTPIYLLAAGLLGVTTGWIPAQAAIAGGPRQAALPQAERSAAVPPVLEWQVAFNDPPPVVRPHGSVHPIRPRGARRPAASTALPLPLPPPLPTAETAPAAPAAPTPQAAPSKPVEAKPLIPELPVPRFASLRSDDVNMRAGPGFRYPIEWVYKRRDLPVEIERDFEVWRLVEDPDGHRGWMHEATLSGRRTFIVGGAAATLRAHPTDEAGAVAILQPGVIGRIRYCHKDSTWCRVQAGQYDGFLKRTQFWGTLPNEVIPAP